MSFVDIAPLLERSPDAVRKLWYRAVERLQGELAAASGQPVAMQPHVMPRH
jgi:DNA-directed RNA polymerase specialized sigma24 family protein